jgi:hypothetical protein
VTWLPTLGRSSQRPDARSIPPNQRCIDQEWLQATARRAKAEADHRRPSGHVQAEEETVTVEQVLDIEDARTALAPAAAWWLFLIG